MARVFEPAVLQERMLTERDDVIRLTDVAERLQIRDLHIGPRPEPTDEALRAEAEWILAQARGQNPTTRSKSAPVL